MKMIRVDAYSDNFLSYIRITLKYAFVHTKLHTAEPFNTPHPVFSLNSAIWANLNGTQVIIHI